MDINWDDQPKGYPVWIEDLDGGMSGWHRDDGDRYTSEDGCFWTKPEDGYYTAHFKPEISWTGEGLPPVGTVCERSFGREIWKSTTICGHSTDGAYAAFYDGDGLMGWSDDCKFRPEELTRAVEARLDQDVLLYGTSFALTNEDGTITRLDPTKIIIRGRKFEIIDEPKS